MAIGKKNHCAAGERLIGQERKHGKGANPFSKFPSRHEVAMKQLFELLIDRIKNRDASTDQAELMRLIDDAVSATCTSAETPSG